MIKCKYTFAKNERGVDVVRGEHSFPPSHVSKLGYADLGQRIRGMLEHGKLVAENLTEQGEYDEETPLKIDGTVDYSKLHNSTAEVDELNDISLDKIDMLEKRDKIISRVEESKENIKNAISDIEKKSSEKTNSVNSLTKGVSESANADSDNSAVD